MDTGYVSGSLSRDKRVVQASRSVLKTTTSPWGCGLRSWFWSSLNWLGRVPWKSSCLHREFFSWQPWAIQLTFQDVCFLFCKRRGLRTSAILPDKQFIPKDAPSSEEFETQNIFFRTYISFWISDHENSYHLYSPSLMSVGRAQDTDSSGYPNSITTPSTYTLLLLAHPPSVHSIYPHILCKVVPELYK